MPFRCWIFHSARTEQPELTFLPQRYRAVEATDKQLCITLQQIDKCLIIVKVTTIDSNASILRGLHATASTAAGGSACSALDLDCTELLPLPQKMDMPLRLPILVSFPSTRVKQSYHNQCL
jgi:hypothetical protein